METISEYKLVRKIQWDGDVLKVQDTMHDVLREAKQAVEDAMNGEVLNHFECDFSDFREYMHDKEEWKRKQVTMQKWIPVTVQLPKVGEDVLIYAIGKSVDFSSVIAITNRMIFRLFPSSDGEEIWCPPWQYFTTNYEITHWMPLPKPPKGEYNYAD